MYGLIFPLRLTSYRPKFRRLMTEALNPSIVLRGANSDRESVKLNVFVIVAVGGFRRRRGIEKRISLTVWRSQRRKGPPFTGCPCNVREIRPRLLDIVDVLGINPPQKAKRKLTLKKRLTSCRLCAIINRQWTQSKAPYGKLETKGRKQSKHSAFFLFKRLTSYRKYAIL